MSITTSSEFIAVAHHTNLGTWLARYDDLPAGAIATKIFRNMDFEQISTFMSNVFLLISEVGIPGNVEAAIVHYISFVKAGSSPESWNLLMGEAEPIEAHVLTEIPMSILSLLIPM